MTALSRMISSQGRALAELAEREPDVGVLAAAERIVLVGTGTSQHAAELGAAMLELAGADARTVRPSRWRAGDAVIVISHTAETARARDVRADALDNGVPVVSITGIGRGWPEAIETVPPEESETYTVSYTSALVVLARIAHALGAPFGSTDELKRVAEIVRTTTVDDVPMPARSLAIAGGGPWSVTAREGALKIREGARMLAEGFDSDRLLHGAAVPLNAADGLIVLQPDALTSAVADAARQEGLQVTTLTSDNDLPPLLDQIPMTVRLQLLADRFAALRGQNPDVAIVGAWAEPGLWRM